MIYDLSMYEKNKYTHRASCNSKADIFTIFCYFVKLHMIVDIERPAASRFAPFLINK